MDTLKALWYVRKVRIYEALVRKMADYRRSAKLRQAKYQTKAEKYRLALKDTTSL
jgi:hypothetical protein